MFTKLYRRLREQSDDRSLIQKGQDTFQGEVNKQLESYFLDIDEDSTVTVVWHSDDVLETKRALKADYSIDINANGIELDSIGSAHISQQGQYGANLTCYRNSERGTDHDYIDKIDVASYNEKEFVRNIVEKVKKVWKEAEED